MSGSFHAMLMNICVRLIQRHEVGYPAKASMAQPVMPFAEPAGVMIGQRVDGVLGDTSNYIVSGIALTIVVQ